MRPPEITLKPPGITVIPDRITVIPDRITVIPDRIAVIPPRHRGCPGGPGADGPVRRDARLASSRNEARRRDDELARRRWVRVRNFYQAHGQAAKQEDP